MTSKLQPLQYEALPDDGCGRNRKPIVGPAAFYLPSANDPI
jgi:hypothetical protein